MKSKFYLLLALSTLFVAGNAAFFSVFGISKLFSGAFLSVVLMASSLELAKLVGASFLYRYWKKINLLMKVYMTIGVITLIGITSAGIFGYLSNAYQGATIDFEKQSTILIYKEDRLEQLVEDKVYLKEELEQSIASLPDNYITARRKLREKYNPKVLKLNDQILNIKQEVSDLKVVMIETGVDVGPAIYIARVFETDIDTVVKFFILIIIFVFDPLAIALVLATNIALLDNDVGEKKKRRKHFFDKMVIKKIKSVPKKIKRKKSKMVVEKAKDKPIKLWEHQGEGTKSNKEVVEPQKEKPKHTSPPGRDGRK